MSELDLVRIVSLVGFLVLAVSALAGHRLSWRKGLVMTLAWASIFLAVYLVIGLVTA